MFCSSCGNSINAGDQFCNICKTQVRQQIGSPAGMPVYVMPASSPPGQGLATASLILSIFGVMCYGFILGPISILLAALAKKEGFKGGMATVGLVLGIIATIFWVGFIILYIIAFARFGYSSDHVSWV